MVIPKSNSGPYRKKIPTIKVTIDIRTFTIICRYTLSSSSYLRMSHLLNLRKFMVTLDPSVYENDIEKQKRVRFINLALEARIDHNLTNQEMIITHIYSNLDFDVDFIDLSNIEMNADEIMWVHKLVEDSLKYFFIYESADQMLDICTKIKGSDFNQRAELIAEYENILNTTQNRFRQVKQDTNATDIQFSLRDGDFEKSLRETYDLITNPSRRLITGMQGLNEMLGGGFESGRTYMFFGLTGIGKSIVLLNIIYQMKKYNRFYKPKDPTKIPCIVLLTMENTVVETLTRLFDMSVENSMGMENYTFDEVLNKLRNEGELVLNSNSPIEIVIRYKANKSVDTNYLYELYDELENDGYEIICLVQDHVKRIRSIWGSAELRLELGDIVNEFKVFAAEKDIPVITNSHLNRDAARVVEDDSTKANKTDITMKLGKSNAGESLLMIDNLDCAFIINPDYDEEGNKHMVFKSIKARIKEGRTYIVQPFAYGSPIRLVEDVGGIPQFKESLHVNRQIVNRNKNVSTTSSNIFAGFQGDNQENSFSKQSAVYNMNIKPDQYEDNDEIQLEKPNIIIPVRFLDTNQTLTKESLLNLKANLPTLNAG